MKEDIKEFIKKVQKPGRYIGGEPGSVYKDLSDIDMRVAFCFPDIYDIGMSNLGMSILCGVLNEIKNVWCERVFAPWFDMEKEMRKRNISLFSLESGDPVKKFDMVAFTLQYELCYTTAVNMLDLAGIPVWSRDRTDEDPIVIAGGPCTFNPEPMADFIDIFSIGEGEESIPELAHLWLDMKSSGKYTRRAFLRRASKLKGFYVPDLYDVEYNDDGTISRYKPKYDDVPEKVVKRIISDLDKCYVPTDPVIPLIETVQERVTLEVYRGCIREIGRAHV